MKNLQANLAAGQAKIAVVGLGYVGLPLGVEFAKKYKVIGFDINGRRIEELKEGRDRTQEADPPRSTNTSART